MQLQLIRVFIRVFRSVKSVVLRSVSSVVLLNQPSGAVRMSLRNRREFLHDAGRLTAAVAAAGLLTPAGRTEEPKAKFTAAADMPAGRKLRVALIGANGTKGRGHEHTGFIAGLNDCELVTICDCDEAVVGPSMTKAEKQQGRLPKYEKDLRRVIDDPNVDVISIATPNHWHALAAIWAMQAGKHVYVEKPVSHNVSEGRRVVEAARHYKKVCQTGTQCRSSTANIEAVDYIRSGKLGKVSLSRGLCYKPRPTIGKVHGDGDVPASIDMTRGAARPEATAAPPEAALRLAPAMG